MAKKPDPETTKTRLHPVLGPASAAQLYRRFLLDTIQLVRDIEAAEPILAVHPPDSVAYFESLAPGITTIVQVGHDLGARLDHVLGAALDTGFAQAVAIGSDSPTLPLDRIESAFAQLDDPLVDVALGPADDGGYYLIGVKGRPGPLVTEVMMSTSTVLDDTIEAADTAGVAVALLEPWYDVDSPDDLARLRIELADHPGRARYTGDFLIQLDGTGGLRPPTDG